MRAPILTSSNVTLRTVRRESWTLNSSLGTEALKMGVRMKLDGSLGTVRIAIVVWKSRFRRCLQSNALALVQLYRTVGYWYHDSERISKLD